MDEVADLLELSAAAAAGSSHVQHLRQLGLQPAQIILVDFMVEAYTALAEDRADFVLADSTSARTFLRDMPDFHVALTLPGEDHYGIALPKGSELLPLLDRFLEEAQDSGFLNSVIEKNLHLGAENN